MDGMIVLVHNTPHCCERQLLHTHHAPCVLCVVAQNEYENTEAGRQSGTHHTQCVCFPLTFGYGTREAATVAYYSTGWRYAIIFKKARYVFFLLLFLRVFSSSLLSLSSSSPSLSSFVFSSFSVHFIINIMLTQWSVSWAIKSLLGSHSKKTTKRVPSARSCSLARAPSHRELNGHAN